MFRHLTLAAVLGCSALCAYDYPTVRSEQEIVKIYPHSIEEITQRKNETKELFHKEIESFLKLKGSSKHILQKYDELMAHAQYTLNIFNAFSLVEPNNELRSALVQAHQELKEDYITTVYEKTDLYKKLASLQTKEQKKKSLSEEEYYYLEEIVKGMKKEGMHLEGKKRNALKAVNIELTQLSEEFDRNIQEDQSAIFVGREALTGVSDDFIDRLEKVGDVYRVTCDYPTYLTVMKKCENSETRKELYRAFMNRAYPQNIEVLGKMISKRDQLAKMLNFPSFAHLQLSNEMVKDPDTVKVFLKELSAQVIAKQKEEFSKLKEAFPNIALAGEGRFYPWDLTYIQEKYVETYYGIDQEKIREYFPLNSTIEGLIGIFEKFFDLKMQNVAIKDLWHEDVQLLQVTSKDGKKNYGYVLLDLFPRPNKYSHACHATIISGLDLPKGEQTTALSLVVANFPKPTPTQPSLMKFDDVETFFHELGHGIHALMGRTQFCGTAGTSTTVDFVELPSQMLEEWLFDSNILAMVSSHYKTKESLPNEFIDQLIAKKNVDTGAFIARQSVLSQLSLECFLEGEKKDTDAIHAGLFHDNYLYYVYDPSSHFQAAFGHLNEYGARYYGYLWSRVLGLDVFEQVKKEGLLNAEAGKRYVKEILGRGGSVDPMKMIKEYLGRDPSQEAFLKAYGIKESIQL